MSESSLIKLQAIRTQNLFKKTPTQIFFGEICKIIKNTWFYRLVPMAGSAGLRFPAWNFAKKKTPAKMFFL